MSSWMSWIVGKKDNRGSARDAIVGLRSQLLMLDKKEEHLNKKIEEELKKAKANATSNKRLATAALRQKKAFEGELDRIAGTRLTLESQVNALESANMNLETITAMKKGSDALKSIHGNLNIDKVDSTMDSIREQMDLTNEISDAISNPVHHDPVDEDELNDELEQLEQDELNNRLLGAERAPVHAPVAAGPQATASIPATASQSTPTAQSQEDDEDEELRQLQAQLAISHTKRLLADRRYQMQFTLFTVLTILAITCTSLAKFTITVPNKNNWWIASESQTFAWKSSASDPDQFIVIIKNDDEKVLPSKQAAVTGIVDSERGSYQVDNNAGVNLDAGKGYYLVFADPTDQNKEYAQSEEFEIKPKGSQYPDPSATIPSTANAKPTGSSNNSSNNDDSSRVTQVSISMVALALVGLASLVLI
ncbi:Snf7-domain-containing protein [Wallemia mellicola]|uniref:Vacuolar-sorting protein SNF7 n=1 Tax=Wallemia mellicola TaxID=1708541 RepID=A0A4T0NTS8_9BASI|nr:Snf7-domain-containing protein [Wallemia mellicola]TIC11553.1 Snf7-domain-containing protein [Wallemia mellicola]